MSGLKALDQAIKAIKDGALVIDEEGRIWRVAWYSPSGVKSLAKARRAESPSGKGYLRLTFGVPGKNATQSVMAHRVVWVWFHGPIPEGMQINHRDGNKKRNRLSNLELVTPAENMRHAWDELKRPTSWMSKRLEPDAYWREKPLITANVRQEMQSMRATGAFYREIAERFNCSITHAQRITAVAGDV